MDFAYHYTEEQERFRQTVSAWLSDNLPQALKVSGVLHRLDPVTWEQCRVFQRRLGEKGWLAPTQPEEWGGGGLTPAHEVILREELGKRGLGGLLEEATASLQRALQEWGTPEQKQQFLPALARGQIIFWHPFMEPGAELDPSNLGVQAFSDGDDYILDGQDHFVGQGLWPDYLWTLALPDPDALPDEATATFLVPAGLEGIRIQTPRLLLPGEAHRVTFDQVRVPRTCLLGNDREGWPLMDATLLAEPLTEHASLEEQEVADLLQYAQETTREGVPLSEEPILQQLLLEAYINSRISRLFRMRNSWIRATGQPLTYHAAQTALWEKRTALRLSEIVREIVGIYALLDHQDPRAPTQGDFELQQRRSLAQQNPSGTVEVYAGVMAKRLGLGEIKRGRRVAPPKEAPTSMP